MARKGQVSIQDTLETNAEFQNYLDMNHNILICMEVYSEFCGHCLATSFAIRKGKLELGGDQIAMAKAAADNIDALSRFAGKSEPVFLFIFKGKLTRAMFGANGIELCKIIEEELGLASRELQTGVQMPKQEITELLPEESEKLQKEAKLEHSRLEAEQAVRTRAVRARKQRVSARLAARAPQLNYIMFWPHCHHAHYDLYEKWDMISVQVAGKETIQISEENVGEALYMSDVDPNEACLHMLMNGEALVVLFKMSDSDERDFVKLMRYALYEEIPVVDEEAPPEKQIPPVPAYERYASISKTAREVRRDRHEAKLAKLRAEKEERDRLAAEQARLAREAEEDRLRVEKQRQDEERMARIQAGLPADPEPENKGEEAEGEQLPEGEGETEPAAAEEEVEVEEEFHSDVSVEGEDYIPPGGLLVPGLYSPPNDLARANGLKLFYPKVLSKITPLESEHLPPHLLVVFHIDKRHDVQDVVKQYADEILQVGVFVGEDIFTSEHLAYTVKQYDKMERTRKNKDRLALMVSRRRSLPLLQLAGLSPAYISTDAATGEADCLALFPVGYGDDYFEEESVMEEEVVIPDEPEVIEDAEGNVNAEEVHEEEDEEEGDD